MKRKVIFFVLIVIFIVVPVCEAGSKIGIVLLHGKNGSPASPSIVQLVNRLKFEGFVVIIPDMPYSKGRQYDKSYEDTMVEVDEAVAELKKLGANKIFIAGHSLGANVALYYATTRTVNGVLAIGPGHRPESPQSQKLFEESIDGANALIKEGKGEEHVWFQDSNQGKNYKVKVTANIYLSWFAPEGHAVMPKNAALLKSGTALFLAVGTQDRIFKEGSAYIFDRAPANVNNKYFVVNSDHLDTPKDAAEEIVTWLKRFE
jgi:pimeloyl-ACP methyl ester carboxylesterase